MRAIRRSVLVVTPLLSVLDGAHGQGDPEKAATAAATAWLSLIDDGRYAEGWKQASKYFQGVVSEPQWVSSLGGARRPLGKLVSRSLTGAVSRNTVPGAPDGHYVIMQFEASFGQKKSAVETVTFLREADGAWKAAGYYIR